MCAAERREASNLSRIGAKNASKSAAVALRPVYLLGLPSQIHIAAIITIVSKNKVTFIFAQLAGAYGA